MSEQDRFMFSDSEDRPLRAEFLIPEELIREQGRLQWFDSEGGYFICWVPKPDVLETFCGPFPHWAAGRFGPDGDEIEERRLYYWTEDEAISAVRAAMVLSGDLKGRRPERVKTHEHQ